MDTQFEIQKVKLRDGMFATISYDEIYDTTVTDQVVKVCNNPVHDDFKDKLQALAVHCILICELVDISKVKSKLNDYHPPMLEMIKVKSITIGGDEGKGVVISFERKLSTGRVLNINTPFVKFNDEKVKYKFDYQLQTAFDELIEEVVEYLNGKFGEGAQLSMQMDEASNHDDSNPHL